VVTHQTDQHYTGSVTYTAVFGISGKVTFLTAEGSPMSGVTLTFSGLEGTVTTDAQGDYSRIVPSGWSGAVTPSKSNYGFSPTSRTYSNVTTSQTNQNYTGTMVFNPFP